jgi:hypothetical protein
MTRVPPLNDLERLLAKPKFGPQDYPEMFRLLREMELVFLLPYHPELEGGSMDVQNGGKLPPFVVWTNPGSGPRIPIFTSLDRAQEACRKTRARDNQYALCKMPGQQLFELLSCQTRNIAINPATGLLSVMLDVAGVKQVALLGPGQVEGETKTGRVKLLTAADYPTELVQVLFQYLRGCPDVRAAWLSKNLARTEPGTDYIALVLGARDQKKIRDDILIVAGSALEKDSTLHVSFLERCGAEALATFEKFTPFYAAPDYKAADPLGPG